MKKLKQICKRKVRCQDQIKIRAIKIITLGQMTETGIILFQQFLVLLMVVLENLRAPIVIDHRRIIDETKPSEITKERKLDQSDKTKDNLTNASNKVDAKENAEDSDERKNSPEKEASELNKDKRRKSIKEEIKSIKRRFLFESFISLHLIHKFTVLGPCRNPFCVS